MENVTAKQIAGNYYAMKTTHSLKQVCAVFNEHNGYQ